MAETRASTTASMARSTRASTTDSMARSATKTKTHSSKGLDSFQLGHLLYCMEGLSEIQRGELTMSMLIGQSAQNRAYFKPDLRVAFRRKLQTFKRQPFQTYLGTLAIHNVEAGPRTVAEAVAADLGDVLANNDEESVVSQENEDEASGDAETVESGDGDEATNSSGISYETVKDTMEEATSSTETEHPKTEEKEHHETEEKEHHEKEEKEHHETEYLDSELENLASSFEKHVTIVSPKSAPASPPAPGNSNPKFDVIPSVPVRNTAFHNKHTISAATVQRILHPSAPPSTIHGLTHTSIMNTPPRSIGPHSVCAPSSSTVEQDFWEGHRKKPVYVSLNHNHPMRTLHGFVPKKKFLIRHGWLRPAYIISAACNVVDTPLVRAEMPAVGEFPEYEGHCMLVAMPSLVVSQRVATLLHEDIDFSEPEMVSESKAVEEAWETLKKQDEHLTWYLLHFDDLVNNMHFSQNTDKDVETNSILSMVPTDFENNDTGHPIPCGGLFWEMACHHGGKKLASNKKKKKTNAEKIRERQIAAGNSLN
jgi:hypothetical protein